VAVRFFAAIGREGWFRFHRTIAVDGEGAGMRTFLVALAIVLLTVPAYAQGKGGGKRRNATADPQAEGLRKKRSVESEKAYKSALDKIPNKPPRDPWANMRETPRPK
jgi:hypothetical protein